MTAGTSVTKRQAAVLDRMKISATELAKRMQVDAQGAILDFLSAVNKLPKAEQTAALSDYFGTESVGAIAPLLTRLDLLKESYDQVGDSAKYAGSMEREFASRSETTENKIIIAKNSLNKLSMVLGDTFLALYRTGGGKSVRIGHKVCGFCREEPEAGYDNHKGCCRIAGVQNWRVRFETCVS
jgi:phage tail tape measure protein, TP901 family, core region